MPNYEVELMYGTTVVVLGAQNEEEALEFAEDQLPMMVGLELFDSKVRKLKRGKATESAVRHADHVSRPE
jgi:hypothetical protein